MSEKTSKLETVQHLRFDMETKQEENNKVLVDIQKKDWEEKE